MREKLKSNIYLYPIILAFSYILFSLKLSPIFESLAVDKEVFQYIGMLIKNNMSPYIDVFDHKPPVIYLLNYLGHLISPNSTWGIYIIMSTFGYISSILVFFMAEKRFKNKILALTLSTIYISCINSDYFIEGGNYTRQLTTYLTTAIIFLVFYSEKNRLKFILLGVLISIIFYTQQNEILSGLIIIAYYILFKKYFHFFSFKEITANICFFLVGLLITNSCMFIIIMHWDNLNAFIEQAFLFNFNEYIYIEKKSFLTKIGDTIFRFGVLSIKNTSLFILIIIISINLISNVVKRKTINSELIVLIIAMIAQIISESISGQVFGHYYLMFIPFIILFFINTHTPNNHTKTKYLFTGLLALVFLFSLKNISFKKQEDIFFQKLLKQVSSVKNKPGQFYTFDAKYLRVNYNLNIISPSKYVYTHFLDEEKFLELTKDLKAKNTKYILFFNALSSDIPNELKSFLYSNYTREIRNKQYTLYIKNESQNINN